MWQRSRTATSVCVLQLFVSTTHRGFRSATKIARNIQLIMITTAMYLTTLQKLVLLPMPDSTSRSLAMDRVISRGCRPSHKQRCCQRSELVMHVRCTQCPKSALALNLDGRTLKHRCVVNKSAGLIGPRMFPVPEIFVFLVMQPQVL